jgi:hypothetical protein
MIYTIVKGCKSSITNWIVHFVPGLISLDKIRRVNVVGSLIAGCHAANFTKNRLTRH